MSKSLEASPPIVVLAPDILAKSFFDPVCHRMMEGWRDGAFRTAVSSPLLRYYAQVLQGLGIPEKQLRRWLLWFTAPDKSQMLNSMNSTSQSLPVILLETAQQSKAQYIIAVSTPDQRESCEKEIPWLEASEFIKQMDL